MTDQEVKDVSLPPTHDFNGGKMQHIFSFVTDPKTRVSKYVKDQFTSPEAQEALLYGTAYIKIDGSNGMIRLERTDNEFVPYEIVPYFRQDLRNKPLDPKIHCPLPPGKNPDTYTNHTYCYVKVDPSPKAKKQAKINNEIYGLLDTHREELMKELEVHNHFLTVEWVGKKFNATPGVDTNVGMVLHHKCVLEESFERTFDGLRTLLTDKMGVEGLILAHKGLFWKVRSNLFDANNSFDAERRTSHPPRVFTMYIQL